MTSQARLTIESLTGFMGPFEIGSIVYFPLSGPLKIQRRDCVQCGASFMFEVKSSGRYPVCCSDECYRQRKLDNNAKRRIENRDRLQPHKGNCRQCGSQITELKRRTFCSEECAIEAKAPIGRPSKRKAVCCEQCHVTKRLYVRDRDAGRFCSKECEIAHRAHVAEELAALRRIANRVKRECLECRSLFNGPKHQKYCSSVCSTAKFGWSPSATTCSFCCDEFVTERKWQRTCSYECAEKLKRRRRHIAKATRRARAKGAHRQQIDPIKVFERDRWRCHICGHKTPKKLRGSRDPRAPELEHMVSYADGGAHTWGNVACACRQCNRKKGAASAGQLGFNIPV